MPTPSPALAALRERTREVHEKLEAAAKLAAPDAGRKEYVNHVAAMRGWVGPLERVLWSGPWPEGLRVGERAAKAAWLDADIAIARADGFEIAIGEHAPIVLATSAARFGAAYVIEGSMLGGATLLSRLRARLAPWPLRYLQGYGKETARNWQAFLAALAAHVATPRAIEEASDGAYNAFIDLDAWLRARGAA